MEAGEAGAAGLDMHAFQAVLDGAPPPRRPGLWRHMQRIVLQATASQALRTLRSCHMAHLRGGQVRQLWSIWCACSLPGHAAPHLCFAQQC